MLERYCITVPPCRDIICENGVPKIFWGTAFPSFPLDYTTADLLACLLTYLLIYRVVFLNVHT